SHRVEVEVRDTGKGISPEALPSIFNAFEQGEPAVTQQFGGLGLGLSIAKAVVDRHGGAVPAASDGPGPRPTVMGTLPLRPTTKGGNTEPGPPPLDQSVGRIRVLLVEAHVDTAKAMVKLLERAGYQVAWADRVSSALELTAECAFDVIVSDIGLPDGSD